MLSNTESSSRRIGSSLAAILLDIPVVAPYKLRSAAINSKVLARYAGNKYKETNFVIDSFLLKAGKLYLHSDGKDYELTPEPETKFYVEKFPHVQFKFEVSNTGSIIKAYRINEGLVSELKKID